MDPFTVVNLDVKLTQFIAEWKELADSALTQENRDNLWGGVEYYFVLGKLLWAVFAKTWSNTDSYLNTPGVHPYAGSVLSCADHYLNEDPLLFT